MQSFSFRTAKLRERVTLEVDRRWVRMVDPKGRGDGKQIHIDFNQIDTIHYWVAQSRGLILTGHFVVKDKLGRKLALQCSSFGQGEDFAEFLRMVAATLAAVGEVRPDVRVATEPTAFHRGLMGGLIMVTVVVAGAVAYSLDTETDWTRIGGPVAGFVIAAAVVAVRYGPLRKKPALAAASDVARGMGVQAG